jgi:uncharacterized protein (DUF2062 family)
MKPEPFPLQTKRTKEQRCNRCRRSLKLFYLRILRLRGKPEKVAGGMAIGIAVGLTPTVPLHFLLAILIAFLLDKSKLAAALGVWVGNPFMLPFVYLLDYKVGQFITSTAAPPLPFSSFSITHLVELGWTICYPLFIGGLVVGLLSFLPAYLFVKQILIFYREKRRNRSVKIGFSS